MTKGLGKGLSKNESSITDNDAATEDFISGAEKRANRYSRRRVKKKAHKPCIFSLTQEINDDIDKLLLAPKDFKASRSDVIKAGIEVLKGMKKTELVEAIRRIK